MDSESPIDFPIVFQSNPMLISHPEEDLGDFHIRDLEMTPKGQSRSTCINWAMVNIFVYIGTLGLGQEQPLRQYGPFSLS